MSTELGDRFAVRRVLDIPNHHVFPCAEECASLIDGCEVEELSLGVELLIDVGRLHPVHERVGLCEEHLRTRVPLPDGIVLESVHLQFRQIQ